MSGEERAKQRRTVSTKASGQACAWRVQRIVEACMCLLNEREGDDGEEFLGPYLVTVSIEPSVSLI